jgi:glycerol-3-phosphate dehydrogenase
MAKTINTEVLVIGGGATGTGVARDLAMRGFKTTLVEKRDYTHGTTGRYHGLLHSGGRYVVKDPLAARECNQENRILRRIMPHCIEDTGGFFVQTPSDDPAYAARFLEGCHSARIPVEEIPVETMLKEESLLNPAIKRCFRVPDGSADSFLGAHANVQSAQEYGASILNYHPVRELELEGNRVTAARCHDLIKDEDVMIHADMVVNAAGAWTGKIAATIGVPLTILPGKGVMIAVNHRVVNTVVNRCHMPSDGDILVPAHTVAIIGTTDVRVDDPEHFGIEPWETRLLLEEGEKLVPGFKNMRMLRAWAGVRPLYQEEVSDAGSNRDVTRAFVLLDHDERDGIAGLITITSGKWTTYRKMAEVTVDLVCKKLGTQRKCRTHLEALPAQERVKYHSLGTRLGAVEESQTYGQLVCECELATYHDVENAIKIGAANTLDDIRRDVRLGMGPCQAGFCSLRAVGILHQIRKIPVESANASLRDFLQERWKGVMPILWGQQLRQERLNELVYRSLLATELLPGRFHTLLGPELYNPPVTYEIEEAVRLEDKEQVPLREFPKVPTSARKSDLVVVGAGLAGLIAAWQAAKRGKHVKVVTKGWGAQHWHTGCIDILGIIDPGNHRLVENPVEELPAFLSTHPNHPYQHVGVDILEKAISALKDLGKHHGYPLLGELNANILLPTSLGAMRPTCLAPASMIAGDLRDKSPILIVGFGGYVDFYPQMVAANLGFQGIPSFAHTVEPQTLSSYKFISTRVLAELFENRSFREEVIRELKEKVLPQVDPMVNRLGFPAVLGLRNAASIHKELEEKLQMRVFEIPTLPPSIPGIRLHQLILQEIESLGGRVYDGMEVLGHSSNSKWVSAVFSEAAARLKMHASERYVLATGGLLGGGFIQTQRYQPVEAVFGLPLSYPADPRCWFEDDFLAPEGHPFFQSGILVNADFQPVDRRGEIIYENLFAVGNLYANCDALVERSMEGIALVSGYVVGNL